MTPIRSNATRFALAAVLTLATATGAFAASRSEINAAQAAREAAAQRTQAAWGAYAYQPSTPSFGAYGDAPQGYGYGYTSLSSPDRHDQAKGDID
ncbi:hypothetical protein [Rhodoplanes roseus]|uniref:BA14K family protein n=1 Tax=Rhodoplanes roseus TaxID=29409 RepID=A0A327L6L1_9BRAD|nr:hypothetical protein [Rhodoplanes roseus]RAI45162.1 hypothetical protein CH341_05565 [Rhodoplanes roseus]